MIYICDSCKFTFERRGEVSSCPVCNATNLRVASPQEEKDYYAANAQDGPRSIK